MTGRGRDAKQSDFSRLHLVSMDKAGQMTTKMTMLITFVIRLRAQRVVTAVVLTVSLVGAYYVIGWRAPSLGHFLSNSTSPHLRPAPHDVPLTDTGKCSDVLTGMTKGAWQQHPMSSSEQLQLKTFYKAVSITFMCRTKPQQSLFCFASSHKPQLNDRHGLIIYKINYFSQQTRWSLLINFLKH